MQVPSIEKHPLVRFTPFAKVDDAVADVTFKSVLEIPPEKDDVADEVAVR